MNVIFNASPTANSPEKPAKQSSAKASIEQNHPNIMRNRGEAAAEHPLPPQGCPSQLISNNRGGWPGPVSGAR